MNTPITYPAHSGGYRRKEKTVKKRIKNLLIKTSAACAFIGMLAAPGTIVSPGFTWDELPAVIGITAACAGWLSLVAYANRPQKKAPHAGQSKEGAKKITSKTA